MSGITGEWFSIVQYRTFRGCESKAGYPSEGHAIRRAQRMSKRDGWLLMSYKCIDCTAWHIGHVRDGAGHFVRYTEES